jgi:hypothetical protein
MPSPTGRRAARSRGPSVFQGGGGADEGDDEEDGRDALDQLDLNDELAAVKSEFEREEEETNDLVNRMRRQANRDLIHNDARIQAMLDATAEDPVDDTAENVEIISAAIAADPREFHDTEALDFLAIMRSTSDAEWRDFARRHAGLSKGAATRALPPRFFAPALPQAQLDALAQAHKSAARPEGGAVRARIFYRFRDGQPYSMLRELSFFQSALSAVQEAVERVYTVLSIPAFVAPATNEYMFKVVGRHECLYGPERLIDFRYVRDSLLKNTEVELHISRLPFPYTALVAPRARLGRAVPGCTLIVGLPRAPAAACLRDAQRLRPV